MTIEETFTKLTDLVTGLDAEGRCAAGEELSEAEFTLLGLLQKENISKADRETARLAGRSLFDALSKLTQRERWTEKEQAQADVEVRILDHVYSARRTSGTTDARRVRPDNRGRKIAGVNTGVSTTKFVNCRSGAATVFGPQ